MRNSEVQPKARSIGTAVKSALRLEALTIVWMLVEAAVSVGAAMMARSVLLASFGIDSGIELVSACALYWRLRREANATTDEDTLVQATERRVARLSGYLLHALGAYVVVQSAYGLLHRHAAEASAWGLAVTAVAAVGMPFLARAKLRLADKIGSRALRTDAMEALTCGYLSWLVLGGLAANALLRVWWLDSAAALVLVPWLVKEGRGALAGEGCGCHSSS